jgi:hypothetical protein
MDLAAQRAANRGLLALARGLAQLEVRFFEQLNFTNDEEKTARFGEPERAVEFSKNVESLPRF